MRSIYAQEGRVLRCPALGFDLTLPPGWETTFAGVSRGAVHFTIALKGLHPQFSLNAYPEDHPYESKYLQEEVRRKSYPRRLAYPFGEVYNGPVRDPILFLKNRIIFTVHLGGQSPEIWKAADSALRQLSFYPPKVDRLHPTLKDFRYLHPGVPLGKDAAPPGLAEAELRARLRAKREERGIYAPGRPRIPERELPARESWAALPFSFGLVHVALGEIPEAKAAFAECARLLDELLPSIPRQHQAYSLALEAALFAGDLERARGVAGRRNELQGEGKALADRAAYERALPLLILGLDEEARTPIAVAKEVDSDKAWCRGLGACMAAIVERDVDGLGRALEEMLAGHHGSAKRKGSLIWNSESSYVCVPATVLTILARERGLAVSDPPSRRATLKNLSAVYLREFEGRPLEKGTTYDLDVDYLPDALVKS